MSSVKRVVRDRYAETLRLDDYEPKHLGYLLERTVRHSRKEIYPVAAELGLAGRFDPLSPVYFRLLSLIPKGGARVTDLARLSGMTKQALGQFVTVLETEGYAERRQQPTDGRVRIVARTAKGDEVVEVTDDLWVRVERNWRREIGAERWELFREVLVELATGWDPDEVSPPQ